MERHATVHTQLRRSSSSCLNLTTSTTRSMKVLNDPKRPSPFLIKAAKKQSSHNSSQGLLRSTQKELSHILRSEAAIETIERKANSNKHNTLWPKAVLEALDDAIRLNRWESALKIFGLLRKQHWYEPRSHTYTKLLVMLGKCRQPNQAILLFDFMKSDGLEPTIDVYTALVSAYGFSGLLDKALEIVDHMKVIPDCMPDVYTYSILINCCTKIRRFDMIGPVLDEMSYLGIECSSVTYNTIIDGYGRAKLFELMENTLTDMVESGTCLPDTYTFNSVVGAYGNSGLLEKMENWFDEFQLMGLTPSIMTFNILIKSYGKVGMHDKMWSVFEFMKKRFISPTIVTFNIIIETFGKAGNIEKMDEFFLKMKHQGMKPNAITYCSLVSAYSKAGRVKKIDSIMRQVENSDVILDTTFFNCVISAYGLAGDVERMGELFLAMKERRCKPDNITYATMVHAYKAVGMVEAAHRLEAKMVTVSQSSGMEGVYAFWSMKHEIPSNKLLVSFYHVMVMTSLCIMPLLVKEVDWRLVIYWWGEQNFHEPRIRFLQTADEMLLFRATTPAETLWQSSFRSGR